MSKLLKAYDCSSIHKSRVAMYDDTKNGGYHILITEDLEDMKHKRKTTVKYRNCGNKNIDYSIQFEIETVVVKGKKAYSHFTSFSLPYEMAKDFINQISTEV